MMMCNVKALSASGSYGALMLVELFYRLARFDEADFRWFFGE